jgi:hypothetical protein
MVGIPYGAIAIGIALLLGVWAVIEAETTTGRVLIISVLIVLFILPALWRGAAGRLAQIVGSAVFGIGCYIFIKLKGVGIR